MQVKDEQYVPDRYPQLSEKKNVLQYVTAFVVKCDSINHVFINIFFSLNTRKIQQQA